MKCYHCKQQIDDDSLFCDQCGEQIFLCPDCHIPGKGAGKRCGQCGKPLIAAGETSSLTSKATEQQQQQQQQPVQASHQSATHLICRQMGISLELSDNLIIGRLEGKYAATLSGFNYLSRKHATIRKDNQGWTITDEGSKNGTTVNGVSANTPLHFDRGDKIQFAQSYDFIAE